jgi:hypothetical protein
MTRHISVSIYEERGEDSVIKMKPARHTYPGDETPIEADEKSHVLGGSRATCGVSLSRRRPPPSFRAKSFNPPTLYPIFLLPVFAAAWANDKSALGRATWRVKGQRLQRHAVGRRTLSNPPRLPRRQDPHSCRRLFQHQLHHLSRGFRSHRSHRHRQSKVFGLDPAATVVQATPLKETQQQISTIMEQSKLFLVHPVKPLPLRASNHCASRKIHTGIYLYLYYNGTV